MTIRGKIRRHNIIPSALLMSAAVAAGLGLSPATAHAAQTMSAVGSGWAVQQAQAIQNAEADAYGNLYDAAGYQPCTNVTRALARRAGKPCRTRILFPCGFLMVPVPD
jgi:hypothetical protein